MRIIKQRLIEMVPEIACFLDVDDLHEIGDLEGYVERSQTILVFCSRGYLESKNCARELTSAVRQGKPLIALLDPEAKHGGMSLLEVRKELEAISTRYPGWCFPRGTPEGAELAASLLDKEPVIEWNRIGVFQDISMRVVAERVLGLSGSTYLEGEVRLSAITVPPVRRVTSRRLVLNGSGYDTTRPTEESSQRNKAFAHVYCSLFNAGAEQLIRQVNAILTTKLTVTSKEEQLARCERMLLLLDERTFTSPSSADLLAEIQRAFDLGVPLVLAHEMPSVDPEDGAARHACEFGDFFRSTPDVLLKAGLYNTLAVPLKGGEWRGVSLKLLAMEFAKEPTVHKLPRRRLGGVPLAELAATSGATLALKVKMGRVVELSRALALPARRPSAIQRQSAIEHQGEVQRQSAILREAAPRASAASATPPARTDDDWRHVLGVLAEDIRHMEAELGSLRQTASATDRRKAQRCADMTQRIRKPHGALPLPAKLPFPEALQPGGSLATRMKIRSSKVIEEAATPAPTTLVKPAPSCICQPTSRSRADRADLTDTAGSSGVEMGGSSATAGLEPGREPQSRPARRRSHLGSHRDVLTYLTWAASGGSDRNWQKTDAPPTNRRMCATSRWRQAEELQGAVALASVGVAQQLRQADAPPTHRIRSTASRLCQQSPPSESRSRMACPRAASTEQPGSGCTGPADDAESATADAAESATASQQSKRLSRRLPSTASSSQFV